MHLLGKNAYGEHGFMFSVEGGPSGNFCGESKMGYVLGFAFGNQGHLRTGLSCDFRINEWNHIVATRREGGSVKLYINGKLKVESTGYTGILSITSSDFTFGGTTNSGFVDEP